MDLRAYLKGLSEQMECSFVMLPTLCILVVLLICWLSKTESRVWVRRFYASAMGYVAIVVSVAMLLLFVVQYLPLPLVQHPKPASGGLGSPMRVESAREFYHDCFSDLLTVLSVLGTVFGLMVPIGAYFIQKRSLRDEAQMLQQEMKIRESQLGQKHRALQRSMRNMKKDLDECTAELSHAKEMRSMIFRSGIENMRSNMVSILMMFRLPSLPEDDQVRIIEAYLMQFFFFIRLATACPTFGPFDSDIMRFSDAMQLFRGANDALRKAATHYSSAMTGEDMPSVSGLTLAFDSSQLSILRKELKLLLPALFEIDTNNEEKH